MKKGRDEGRERPGVVQVSGRTGLPACSHSPAQAPQLKAPQPKSHPFGMLLTAGHWVPTPGHLLSALLSLPVWHSLLSLLHVAVFAANSGQTSCSCIFQCAGSVVTIFLCGDSLVFSCDSTGSLKSCLVRHLA